MNDQTGMNTSSESANQSPCEPIADEPNMGVSLSKRTALYLLATTELLLADLHASRVSVPEVYSAMKNVDPCHLTRIVSHSMRNRMQLLTLMAEILGMPLCMSVDGNAICVGNSLWPQELRESSGLVEKRSSK